MLGRHETKLTSEMARDGGHGRLVGIDYRK